MPKIVEEFEIIGPSEADTFMRQNIGIFLGNITIGEKYIKVVRDVKNNIEKIKISNLLKEIRNGNKRK